MSVLWTVTRCLRVTVTLSPLQIPTVRLGRRGALGGPCSRDPRPRRPAPSPAGAESRASGIRWLPARPPLGRGPAPLFVCCLVLGCLFFSCLRHGWLCCSSCSSSADMALSSSWALQGVVSEQPRAPRDGARPRSSRGRWQLAAAPCPLPVLLASSEEPGPPAPRDAAGAQRPRNAGPGQQAAGDGGAGV